MTCLLANLLVLNVIGPRENLAAFAAFGVIIAQPCLLAIWFAMSPDSLRRRSFIVGLSAFALVAAWFIGVLLHLDTLRSVSRQLKQNEFWSVVLTPVFAVAGSLPLIGLRVFLGKQFANRFETLRSDQTSERLTISRILMFTAVVAAALAATQIPVGLNLMALEELAIVVGIGSCVSFGIGLLVVTPVVLVTMRERGSWLTLIFSVVVVTLSVVGLTALIIFLRQSRLSPRDLRVTGYVATTVLAGTIVVACFLGGLRLLGYRIRPSR